MRIVPTTVFLDGRERFKPKRIYEVSPPRAEYFMRLGWAREATTKEHRWYRRVTKHG